MKNTRTHTKIHVLHEFMRFFNVWAHILDVVTRIFDVWTWIGLVFGCLDLYLGVWTCIWNTKTIQKIPKLF